MDEHSSFREVETIAHAENIARLDVISLERLRCEPSRTLKPCSLMSDMMERS